MSASSRPSSAVPPCGATEGRAEKAKARFCAPPHEVAEEELPQGVREGPQSIVAKRSTLRRPETAETDDHRPTGRVCVSTRTRPPTSPPPTGQRTAGVMRRTARTRTTRHKDGRGSYAVVIRRRSPSVPPARPANRAKCATFQKRTVPPLIVKSRRGLRPGIAVVRPQHRKFEVTASKLPQKRPRNGTGEERSCHWSESIEYS